MADEKKQNLENKSLVSQPLLEREKISLPNFFLSVKLKYVKLGYHYLVSNAMSQAPLLLSICILQWELPLFGLDLQQICERGDDCN
uniref:Uncharacterized protein n=1 Tax=Salix viminalis TaxID=40686 RepID=A0A6N2M2A4_SALVM